LEKFTKPRDSQDGSERAGRGCAGIKPLLWAMFGHTKCPAGTGQQARQAAPCRITDRQRALLKHSKNPSTTFNGPLGSRGAR